MLDLQFALYFLTLNPSKIISVNTACFLTYKYSEESIIDLTKQPKAWEDIFHILNSCQFLLILQSIENTES